MAMPMRAVGLKQLVLDDEPEESGSPSGIRGSGSPTSGGETKGARSGRPELTRGEGRGVSPDDRLPTVVPGWSDTPRLVLGWFTATGLGRVHLWLGTDAEGWWRAACGNVPERHTHRLTTSGRPRCEACERVVARQVRR